MTRRDDKCEDRQTDGGKADSVGKAGLICCDDWGEVYDRKKKKKTTLESPALPQLCLKRQTMNNDHWERISRKDSSSYIILRRL